MLNKRRQSEKNIKQDYHTLNNSIKSSINYDTKIKASEELAQAKLKIKILSQKVQLFQEEIKKQKQEQLLREQYQNQDLQYSEYDKITLVKENEQLYIENQNLVAEIQIIKESQNKELALRSQDLESYACTINKLQKELEQQKQQNNLFQQEIQGIEQQNLQHKKEKELLQQQIKDIISGMQGNQSLTNILDFSSLNTTNILSTTNRDNNQVEGELLALIQKLKQENDELNQNLKIKYSNKKVKENQDRNTQNSEQHANDLIYEIQQENQKLRNQLSYELNHRRKTSPQILRTRSNCRGLLSRSPLYNY